MTLYTENATTLPHSGGMLSFGKMGLQNSRSWNQTSALPAAHGKRIALRDAAHSHLALAAGVEVRGRGTLFTAFNRLLLCLRLCNGRTSPDIPSFVRSSSNGYPRCSRKTRYYRNNALVRIKGASQRQSFVYTVKL